MKPDNSLPSIRIDALRLGMFVHIDLGWMSHPFPLNRFRLSSPEQIETLRGLGLKTVRWNPALSELPEAPEEAQAAPATVADPAAAASDLAADPNLAPAPNPTAPAPTSPDLPASSAPSTPTATPPTAPAVATASAAVSNPAAAPHTTSPSGSAPTAGARRAPAGAGTQVTAGSVEATAGAWREALVAQRAGLAACERKFAEATRACREINQRAVAEPLEAKQQATALAEALLAQMAGKQDLCVRLLNEGAGDKASAHALNVSVIALLMGRSFGWGEADLQDLAMGALLHDVGKAELPERLRYRDDSFTSAETRAYEEHVARGVGLARRMGLSAGATLVIAQHHEHADGSGFPQRLGSERMTAAARVVAMANRYDNLCNPRQPSRVMTPHEALSLMFAQYKNQFDTTILGAFIKMMGVYPAGSAVQLTDDRLALVVAVNASRPLKPRVLVHDPKVPRDEALVMDLEHAKGLGIRRSIKISALPADSLQYLAPRPRVAYFFEQATNTGDGVLQAETT